MKKPNRVQLNEEQQTELLKLIHKGNAPARVQTRARILLLAAEGQQDAQIAQALPGT